MELFTQIMLSIIALAVTTLAGLIAFALFTAARRNRRIPPPPSEPPRPADSNAMPYPTGGLPDPTPPNLKENPIATALRSIDACLTIQQGHEGRLQAIEQAEVVDGRIGRQIIETINHLGRKLTEAEQNIAAIIAHIQKTERPEGKPYSSVGEYLAAKTAAAGPAAPPTTVPRPNEPAPAEDLYDDPPVPVAPPAPPIVLKPRGKK